MVVMVKFKLTFTLSTCTVAISTFMSNIQVAFSSSSFNDAGSFRLLELPPDLCKLVECVDEDLSLCIKGNINEDAVLCSKDKTYAIRSLILSNSVLVVSPALEENRLIIRDERHEILEVMPTVPRLHKLGGLLRGREYDEGHESEEEILSDDGEDERQASDISFRGFGHDADILSSRKELV